MATVTKDEKAGEVVSIQPEKVKGESLTQDALKRLFRNKFAIIGMVIIAINILAAVFAPIIAPYSFSEQTLANNNGAPAYIINLFPTMTPRDESFRIGRDWEAVVNTGDQVEVGQVIIQPPADSDDEPIVANMNGTAFVDDNTVVLTLASVRTIDISAGASVAVADGATVEQGDVLITGNATQNVTAEFAGTVYVMEDEIILRSSALGYVPVRPQYPLGADGLGRDLFSRIIYGARVSLLVAFVGPLVSILVGVPYGLVSGYAGGKVDAFMMQFVNLMYAFPTLLLIILLMAFFRTSFGGGTLEPGTFAYTLGQIDQQSGGMLFIFVGVGLTSWMGLARLTRGQVLSLRETEYIVAANSLGVPRNQILMRHILPNILGPIIVTETLTIPTYIRYEAFLSFIGLGVNPPTPSWGSMISEGAGLIRSYPNQALFPALALFFIMFAFNFLGDGLRDAFDPRMRGVD